MGSTVTTKPARAHTAESDYLSPPGREIPDLCAIPTPILGMPNAWSQCLATTSATAHR